MRYLRQLASESLVYGLAGVVTRFISVFLVPVYTRLFTPEDYGVMSLVTTTSALISIFVVLALDNSAHRWFWDTSDPADRKTTLASWAWCQFSLAACFGLILFFAADGLADLVIGRADAGEYLRLVSATFPLAVLGTVLTNWLRLQRRPWATMAYTLGFALGNIGLSVLFVVAMRQGIAGVFKAQLIMLAISTVLALMWMRDWIHPSHFCFARLVKMLLFALPLIPGGIAVWALNLVGRYFIRFYGTTAEVGLFDIAGSIAAVVALGTTAFQQAWGPFAFSIHKEPDAKRVYAAALPAYLWVACLTCAAAALFAPEILRLLTTTAYYGASTVVGFLAFNHVLVGLAFIAALGPNLAKQTKPLGLAVCTGAAVNIGLNFLLVPTYGKEGAAIASLIGNVIPPLYVFYRSQVLYPIPYRFRPAFAIVVLAWAIIGAGSMCEFENAWLTVACKTALLLLFLPALFALGIVNSTTFRANAEDGRAEAPKCRVATEAAV